MRTLLDPDDRAEITDRIRRVRPESSRRWGRMSAHQMVCHLTDAFVTMLGDRPAVEISTLFTRTVVRFVGITVPMKWPRGIRTMPETDQRIGGTPPDDFDEDLNRLLETIDAFVQRLDPGTMRHPLFGVMSRGEWGRWGYRHLDHHARQFGL